MDVNEQSASRLEQLGALENKSGLPIYPQFKDLSKRLESFATWPVDSHVGKQALVDAGFICAADGNVQCYHCGGGFRDWKAGGEPMREHAKMYPHCQHILMVKGQSYIDQVLNGELVEEGASQNVADHSISESEYLAMAACLSCIDMGYSEDMVLNAVQIFKSKHKHDDFKARDICEILFDLEGNTDYERQDTVENEREAVENIRKEENKQQGETKSGQIWYLENACVEFMPCCHKISCAHCGISVAKCPKCSE